MTYRFTMQVTKVIDPSELHTIPLSGFETLGFRVVVEPSRDQKRDKNIAANIDLNTESKDVIEAYQGFDSPKENNKDKDKSQEDTKADPQEVDQAEEVEEDLAEENGIGKAKRQEFKEGKISDEV